MSPGGSGVSIGGVGSLRVVQIHNEFLKMVLQYLFLGWCD